MKLLLALGLAGAVACGGAFAAGTTTDATKADATNSQQQKMKDCNTKAGDMKGDERKAFMKTCLSAKPAPATSKNKMAECNAKTKGMSKADADKARSECMKG